MLSPHTISHTPQLQQVQAHVWFMTLHARRSACVISSHNLSHTSTTTGASPCVVHDIVPHVVLLQFCRSKVSESACMSVCATACACVLACMRACIVSVCVSMHVHVSVLCVCFLVWACALCWVWGKDEALLCYNVHFIRIVLHCEMTLRVFGFGVGQKFRTL